MLLLFLKKGIKDGIDTNLNLTTVLKSLLLAEKHQTKPDSLKQKNFSAKLVLTQTQKIIKNN
jgi:hypothetical protein